MRRAPLLLSLAVVVLLGLAVAGRGAVAQEATPVVAPGGVHPVVGSWLADTDTDDPANPPSLLVFHADGTYVEVEADGAGAGSWAATGERTADLTIVFLEGDGGDEGGGGGMVTIRAAVEVAADGQSLTAQYTIEFTAPDGTSTGQYGPGGVTGTRIAVEPMGTPLGSFEDLFGLFEEGEGTPEP
jgi:hypothetical protein